MQNINQLIAERYLKIARRYRNLSTEECEKITYVMKRVNRRENMKRKCKYLLSICLITAIFMNFPVGVASANSKPKVKSITMVVGQEKKIKIWKSENKIKFSKKGIVSISKKGNVSAKKTGTVNVTIQHQKKLKKYKIVVKAKELKIDFSKVTEMTIRDLVYGYSKELTPEEMETVKELFSSIQLKQYSINSNKSVGNGAMKYKICMYDTAGKELYNLNVGTDYVAVHNGDTYRSSEKINCSILENLMK